MKNRLDEIIGAFVEIRGSSSLLADGIDGLIEYGSERIMLSMGKLTLTVRGSGLTLRFYTKTKIGIEGDISGVEYERTAS